MADATTARHAGRGENGAYLGLGIRRAVRLSGVDVLFITSVAVVTADPRRSRKLYVDALGLPLQGEGDDGYYSSGSIGGSKHFGVWPLMQAAGACFGTSEWPADRVASPGFDRVRGGERRGRRRSRRGIGARGLRAPALRSTEPWGQTVARMLTEDGLIVGISFAPSLHDDDGQITSGGVTDDR